MSAEAGRPPIPPMAGGPVAQIRHLMSVMLAEGHTVEFTMQLGEVLDQILKIAQAPR